MDVTPAVSMSPSPSVDQGAQPTGRRSALPDLSIPSSPLCHVEEPRNGRALSSLERSSFIQRLGTPRAIQGSGWCSATQPRFLSRVKHFPEVPSSAPSLPGSALLPLCNFSFSAPSFLSCSSRVECLIPHGWGRNRSQVCGVGAAWG